MHAHTCSHVPNSIPHGQLWIAAWTSIDYQWIRHNKINNMVVIHDPQNAADQIPEFITELEASSKFQVRLSIH